MSQANLQRVPRLMESLKVMGYRKAKVLGSGSNCVVFKAVKDGCKLAVKCVPLRFSREYTLETKIVPTLQHPNIVELFFWDNYENEFFILEYELMSKDLMSVLENKQTFTENDARPVFIQICSAVSYCHSKHIAHMDIKPENILLSSSQPPEVKLCDFGNAFRFTDDSYLPRRQQGHGTLFYCAPEVLSCGRVIPSKADVWSLGVVLHVMITGRWPFKGNSVDEICYNIISGNVSVEFISAELSDLFAKIFTFCPAERPSLNEVLNHAWSRYVPPAQRKIARWSSDLTNLGSSIIASGGIELRPVQHRMKSELRQSMRTKCVSLQSIADFHDNVNMNSFSSHSTSSSSESQKPNANALRNAMKGSRNRKSHSVPGELNRLDIVANFDTCSGSTGNEAEKKKKKRFSFVSFLRLKPRRSRKKRLSD